MRVVLEWGEQGARAFRNLADVLVVVDVLSFCTCLDVACGRGARVFPFTLHDRAAAAREAERLGAVLAGKRGDAGSEYSLSAPTLRRIARGARLVLPSPNGSQISFAARGGGAAVLAGCLRNASAVAALAERLAGPGGTVAVVPAGERWPDGSLRPAVEDLLGAGAVIAALPGAASAEAAAALAAFVAARPGLPAALEDCVSGRELVEREFAQDVAIASELDVSGCAPALTGEGCFADAAPGVGPDDRQVPAADRG